MEVCCLDSQPMLPSSIYVPDDASSSTSNDDCQRSELPKHSLPPRKRGRYLNTTVPKSDVTSESLDTNEAETAEESPKGNATGNARKNPRQKKNVRTKGSNPDKATITSSKMKPPRNFSFDASPDSEHNSHAPLGMSKPTGRLCSADASASRINENSGVTGFHGHQQLNAHHFTFKQLGPNMHLDAQSPARKDLGSPMQVRNETPQQLGAIYSSMNPHFNSSANLTLLADHVAKQISCLNNQAQLDLVPKTSPQSSECKSSVSLLGVDATLDRSKMSTTVAAPNHYDKKTETRGQNDMAFPTNLPFACSLCVKRFPTAQALGGHQNAHKYDSVFSGKSRRNSKDASLPSGKGQPPLSAQSHHPPPPSAQFNLNNQEGRSTKMPAANSIFALKEISSEQSLLRNAETEKVVNTSRNEASLPVPCCNWHCNYFSMPCKQSSNPTFAAEHDPSAKNGRFPGANAEFNALRGSGKGLDQPAANQPHRPAGFAGVAELDQGRDFQKMEARGASDVDLLVERDFVGSFFAPGTQQFPPRSDVVPNLDLNLHL